MIVNAFNPSTWRWGWGAETGGSLFESSLDYKENSRIAGTTQRNPALRGRKKKGKNINDKAPGDHGMLI